MHARFHDCCMLLFCAALVIYLLVLCMQYASKTHSPALELWW